MAHDVWRQARSVVSDERDKRIAELQAEVDSLRVALRLSESWAGHRDAAKLEVCSLLGLPSTASIHDIVQEIRKLTGVEK